MHPYVVRGLLNPKTIAVFSVIYQTFTSERRALNWRENDLLHERAEKFIYFLHFIHRRNISLNPLDWSLTNFSTRVPHKFLNSLVLILTEMLIWKENDSVKYGDFSVQSQSFRLFAGSKLREAPKQTTFIGLVWLWTKQWTIYTSS